MFNRNHAVEKLGEKRGDAEDRRGRTVSEHPPFGEEKGGGNSLRLFAFSASPRFFRPVSSAKDSV
jgi:hypothetical protein